MGKNFAPLKILELEEACGEEKGKRKHSKDFVNMGEGIEEVSHCWVNSYYKFKCETGEVLWFSLGWEM